MGPKRHSCYTPISVRWHIITTIPLSLVSFLPEKSFDCVEKQKERYLLICRSPLSIKQANWGRYVHADPYRMLGNITLRSSPGQKTQSAGQFSTRTILKSFDKQLMPDKKKVSCSEPALGQTGSCFEPIWLGKFRGSCSSKVILNSSRESSETATAQNPSFQASYRRIKSELQWFHKNK